MRKKLLATLLAVSMTAAMTAGCGSSPASSDDAGAEDAADDGAGDAADDAGTTPGGAAGADQAGNATESDSQVEKVVVAVDDDSFTIAPWGSEGSVRDWTEHTIWAHLCYRPYIGAMLEGDQLQMNAAKSVKKVDDTTYEVELYDTSPTARATRSPRTTLCSAMTSLQSWASYPRFPFITTARRQPVTTP